MDHDALKVHDIKAAVRIAVGDPEPVLVDRRVLRLILGDLAELIILDRRSQLASSQMRIDPDQEHFVWDEDSPCN